MIINTTAHKAEPREPKQDDGREILPGVGIAAPNAIIPRRPGPTSQDYMADLDLTDRPPADTGAPPGNRNARKHGLRDAGARALRARIADMRRRAKALMQKAESEAAESRRAELNCILCANGGAGASDCRRRRHVGVRSYLANQARIPTIC
jgi:hypothetical protein